MGTVKLVACVSRKKPTPDRAMNLYQSTWFKLAKRYAAGDRWFILSAKHELLDPWEVIEPYEMTLNRMTREQCKAWADRVMRQITQAISTDSRIEILAGDRYRRDLVPLLKRAGYRVDVPMAGLGIGQQQAWLKRHDAVQMTDMLAW